MTTIRQQITGAFQKLAEECFGEKSATLGEQPPQAPTPAPPATSQARTPPAGTKETRSEAGTIVEKEWVNFLRSFAPNYAAISKMSDMAELTNAANSPLVRDGKYKYKVDGSAYTMFDAAEDELKAGLKRMREKFLKSEERAAVEFFFNKTIFYLQKKEKDRQKAITNSNRYDLSRLNAKMASNLARGVDASGKQPGMHEN